MPCEKSRLEEMQDGFCCYCESFAHKGNGHIEHFFYKGETQDGVAPYKHLTFIWDNLFGCCGLNGGSTCGHFKDKKGSMGPGVYNPNDIIKPDLDNPEDFFEYLPTGVISVKNNLNDKDERKAQETLRVLNLKVLNEPRRSRIEIFQNELMELFSLDVDDVSLRSEIDFIKDKIKKSEFRTVIMFVLFNEE
nr:retron system putative HNH endonuclease [Halomonas sp. UBA3074]